MTYKLINPLKSETLDYLHRLAQMQPQNPEEREALTDIREKLFWMDNLEIPQSSTGIQSPEVKQTVNRKIL